jgi:6,7-dimethyl-8-ribityllumazine synthase
MGVEEQSVQWSSADRVAIVVADFYRDLAEDLLRGARARLTSEGLGDPQVEVFRVPGAWELPLAVQRLAAGGRFAALIALGAVIRGQTTHDRHLNRFVSLSLGELSLKYDLPIAFGVLTCKNIKQARRRADPAGRDKGGEAAAAAVAMLRLLRSMDSPHG